MNLWTVYTRINSQSYTVAKVESVYVRVVGGSYVFYNNSLETPVAIYPAREWFVKKDD